MSKRARITLDLEPETPTDTTTTSPEREADSTPEADVRSGAGTEVPPTPRPRRAEPPRSTPKTAASGRSRNQETGYFSGVFPRLESAARSTASRALSTLSHLDIGTVLKVAAVGVVAVSTVLLLKRRP
jgi:uncharacterized membrane protein